ncbi:MAG: hypothetical protein AAF694_13510 [Bacteroidota bacterium]
MIVLHLPIFNQTYFLPAESQILLCVKRLAINGGSVYKDAWIGHPPLIVWLFQLFDSLFGSHALFILRILRCFYIYICIVFFSGFVASLRVQDRNKEVIAIALAILLSTPWYSLDSSHTLFCLLPLTFSFVSLFRLESSPSRKRSLRSMFWVGVWVMVCIFLSYKAFFLLFAIIAAYLILRPYRMDEMVSLFGGMAVFLGFLLLILYFSESLTEFFDQGLLYPWDRQIIQRADLYQSLPSTWISIGVNWSVWIFLGILGFTHFRLRYYSYVVKVRLLERLMSVWFFFLLFGILLKGSQVEMQDFILIAPPLSFYGAKSIGLIKRRRTIWLTSIAALLPILLVYFTFWNDPNEKADWGILRYVSFSKKFIAPYELTPKQEVYKNFLAEIDHSDTVWILAEWPQMYLAHSLNPPNKYTEFSMLYQKSNCWNPNKNLLSLPEAPGVFYTHLLENTPQWIVDPEDHFPQLQSCFPSLFTSYSLVSDKNVLVYQRNP